MVTHRYGSLSMYTISHAHVHAHAPHTHTQAQEDYSVQQQTKTIIDPIATMGFFERREK